MANNERTKATDFESPSSSSCSSSPPTSVKHEIDSGCGSDDDPALALKINKGLSMGYDYELIKSVIEQQNQGDDMSKFIETIVRTAEVNGQGSNGTSSIVHSNGMASQTSSPTNSNSKSTNFTDLESSSGNSSTSESSTNPPHDVYIIDGADLAYSYGNNQFSWRGIEICLKYLHSHGHKKVFVALPYSLKHHRHDQTFLESKSLRDLERKNLLVYTNRMSKPTNKPGSYTHISEMLKFSQKTKGHLITNVSLKDVILDFTIYKHILEERVIRYRFQNDNFQPLLVTIVNGEDGNDCETHYPLCPYGKKCTYGSKCKYFHIERRFQSPLSISESLQMKARFEKSKMQHQFSSPSVLPMYYPPSNASSNFHSTKSGPDHLRMYNRQSPMMEQSLVDDARAAYDYGLASASSPPSTDFSFVDQRVPISRPAATPTTTTQATWFTPPTAHPFLNRSFSMPQPTTTFLPTDEQQQLAMATLLMQQQQQHWARPAATSIYPGQPPFEQNVLQLLSMLSLQQQVQAQQAQANAHFHSMMPTMVNPSNVPSDSIPTDRSSVNSHQGLVDKIQSVRHLWETNENNSFDASNIYSSSFLPYH